MKFAFVAVLFMTLLLGSSGCSDQAPINRPDPSGIWLVEFQTPSNTTCNRFVIHPSFGLAGGAPDEYSAFGAGDSCVLPPGRFPFPPPNARRLNDGRVQLDFQFPDLSRWGDRLTLSWDNEQLVGSSVPLDDSTATPTPVRLRRVPLGGPGMSGTWVVTSVRATMPQLEIVDTLELGLYGSLFHTRWSAPCSIRHAGQYDRRGNTLALRHSNIFGEPGGPCGLPYVDSLHISNDTLVRRMTFNRPFNPGVRDTIEETYTRR